jgi:hypothetical protein
MGRASSWDRDDDGEISSLASLIVESLDVKRRKDDVVRYDCGDDDKDDDGDENDNEDDNDDGGAFFDGCRRVTKRNSSSYSSPLPSTIDIYRAGRVLYSIRRSSWRTSSSYDRDRDDGVPFEAGENDDDVDDDDDEISHDRRMRDVVDSFDALMRALPRGYVYGTILRDLHASHASLISSYDASDGGTTTTLMMMAHVPSTISMRDILDATESVCGIYLSSTRACACCGGMDGDGDDVPYPPRDYARARGGDGDGGGECDGSGYELVASACVALSWVYERLSVDGKMDDDDDAVGVNGKMDDGIKRRERQRRRVADDRIMSRSILRTMSRLLVYGVVCDPDDADAGGEGDSGGGRDDDDEAEDRLSGIMNVVRNVQSSLGGYNTALGDMLDADFGDDGLVAALSAKYGRGGGGSSSSTSPPMPPQLQYLLAMLRSSPRRDGGMPRTGDIVDSSDAIVPTIESDPTDATAAQRRSKNMTFADAQIHHVRTIFPELGEGYIEEALRCYDDDLERTVGALLDHRHRAGEDGSASVLHPRLMSLPTNLPRKLRDAVDVYAANVNLHRGTSSRDGRAVEDGMEHARLQKERLRYAERLAEEEAYMIDSVSRGSMKGAVGSAIADDDDEDDEGGFAAGGTRDEYGEYIMFHASWSMYGPSLYIDDDDGMLNCA